LCITSHLPGWCNSSSACFLLSCGMRYMGLYGVLLLHCSFGSAQSRSCGLVVRPITAAVFESAQAPAGYSLRCCHTALAQCCCCWRGAVLVSCLGRLCLCYGDSARGSAGYSDSLYYCRTSSWPADHQLASAVQQLFRSIDSARYTIPGWLRHCCKTKAAVWGGPCLQAWQVP